MNADFDGDELNVILLTDQYLIDAAQDLAPHKGVLDLNKPFKIAGDLAFPAPLVSTIAEWAHGKHRKKKFH